MTYRILSSTSEDALAIEVTQLMRQGYEPRGGVSIGRDGRFHQALVQVRQPDRNGEVRLREPKRK